MTITPSASGTENNYAPTGYLTNERWIISPTSTVTITGIAGGSAGRVLYLENVGSTYTITLSAENGGSIESNRIASGSGATVQSGPGQSTVIKYDTNQSRWVLLDDAALLAEHLGTPFIDSNGNEWLDVSATANAVNHPTITNAATGNGPDIAATGDDTNIDLNLSAKGTGRIKSDTYPIDCWHLLDSTTLTNSTTNAVDFDFRTYTTEGYRTYKIFVASLQAATASTSSNNYLYARKDDTDTDTPVFLTTANHHWFRNRVNISAGGAATGSDVNTFRENSTSLLLASRYPAGRTASTGTSTYPSSVEINMTWNVTGDDGSPSGPAYYDAIRSIQHNNWYIERSEHYGCFLLGFSPPTWLRLFQSTGNFRSGVKFHLYGLKK